MKYEVFKSLSKDKQKEVIEAYKNTVKGRDMYIRFTRIYGYSFLCIIFAIVSFILEILGKIEWWYSFATAASLVVAVVFIIGVRIMKLQQYSIFIKKRNK